MMNENKFIKAISNINDDFLIEALPRLSKDAKRKNDIKVVGGVVAAVIAFVMVMGALLNICVPIYARNMPVVGGVFAYIQDKLSVAENYSNYASKIGETVESNSVSITLSEAYCDGVNLYVGFVVESKTPFASDDYMEKQLDYAGEAYIKSGNSKVKLDDFGIAGLEGEFKDEKTFVGVEVFSLTGETFPNEFVLDMKINSIGLLPAKKMSVLPIKYKKNTIKGDWRFATNIVTNEGDVEVYEINKTINEHSIDKVVVTPIYATIYTSYPDIYYETTNYEVRAYTAGTDEDISSQGEYGVTSGITQIPRSRIVNNELHIYVVDISTLCKSGSERGTQQESKEHAIVSIDLSL